MLITQEKPELNISELQQSSIKKIHELARTYGINQKLGTRKYHAIKLIVQEFDGISIVDGVIKTCGKNYGLLQSSYQNSHIDIRISSAHIKRYKLKKGNMIRGVVISNAKELQLSKVLNINGLPPDDAGHRPEFSSLTPIYPTERIYLDGCIEMRMMDLLTPIGKGQRGLIVAPPRTGKTVLLQKLANAIIKQNPESHLIVLLIDERPEEVTDMARTVPAEIVASTFDKPAKDHVQLAELVLDKAKRMVEYGKDVVILLDSITRLGRAYNTTTPHSGKILTGGIDATALKGPKRFFGAARNVEDGGSLTIIATALIDTNSKMDEVIFEEFKGTGNMELYLDRNVADRRIWPAFEIRRSGTRKEELLCT